VVCAAANERPDLFRAVVARVPFVDCLTSLLDPASRLTQSEWDEFGNPIDDAEVYRYIGSYSPYDNIRPAAYPAMLVTAAYRDARVPYWEPAKFVAKLRATKTDNNLLLFRTAMVSGHNDRWDDRSEESYIMAFLASQLE
jgi:oligopeptidase B